MRVALRSRQPQEAARAVAAPVKADEPAADAAPVVLLRRSNPIRPSVPQSEPERVYDIKYYGTAVQPAFAHLLSVISST